MVTTNDTRLFELALLYGHHPSRQERQMEDPQLREYIDSCCYTYRMHPLSSVIARVQLKFLDSWNKKRRQNADRLSQQLAEIPGIKPPTVLPGGEHVYHMYPMTYCSEELDGLPREIFMNALKAEGVSVGTYIGIPIYLRKRYQERDYFWGKGLPWSLGKRKVVYKKGDCPVAESLADKVLTLPPYIEPKTGFLDQYIAAFRKVTLNYKELL